MAACTDGSCAVRHLTREEKRKEFEHDPANARDTLQGLHDDLTRIGHHYFSFIVDMAGIEENLHDAWDELIHAGKIIPPVSAEHDRLVTLVLEFRELGPFTREKNVVSGNGQEAAIMPNGQRVWSDLPYLVRDFQCFWTEESMGLTITERESLAVLTAKLCAAGVCATDLACCALWLFKQALETERPLVAFSSGEDASKASHPFIADLLPACLEWMKYSNFKLAKLSVENYRPALGIAGHVEHISTSPGPLAAKANVTQEGFSIARWLFWRQQLGELFLHGGEQVAKPARGGFEAMISTGLGVGINIPGEKKYFGKLVEALRKELAARDSKGSIGAEDIEIDPRWANE